MKKTIFGILLLLGGVSSLQAQQVKTETAMVSFHSEQHDITPVSNSVLSTLDTESGEIQFSVPVQSIEFEKSMMQQHFNAPGLMNSAEYPRITFSGKIDNLDEVNFAEDGEYPVTVSGQMTIKDQTRDENQSGTIIVKDGKISALSEFDLDRFEYGVDGKAAHISQVLQIKVDAHYEAVEEENP